MTSRETGRHFSRYLLIISLAVIILDQLTKYLVKTRLAESIAITKFLSISLITNTGAAFGILQNKNQLFIWISIMVLGFIFYHFGKIKTKADYIAISLVIGGIIGNLIDRIVYGYVIDFIDFSFWPAFNVADSSISIGVVILLISSIIEKST